MRFWLAMRRLSCSTNVVVEHVHTYTCIYMYLCVCIYIYVYMYISTYVCVFFVFSFFKINEWLIKSSGAGTIKSSNVSALRNQDFVVHYITALSFVVGLVWALWTCCGFDYREINFPFSRILLRGLDSINRPSIMLLHLIQIYILTTFIYVHRLEF